MPALASAHRPRTLLAALLAAPLLLVACGDDGGDGGGDGANADGGTDTPELDCGLSKGDGGELVVYSGRTEELVGPLLDEYADETGVDISVLYGGDSASVARQISEEGDASPADVFFSQAPGPLSFLEQEERFAPLPDDLLGRVPEGYRSADGRWVGVSGRVRVLVYDPATTPESGSPASVMDLVEPEFEGRLGVAPTNASFQDFVSYLRIAIGDGATLEYLDGLADNGARTYPNNIAIVEAVDRGEIDMGLANHYYVRELKAQDSSLAADNHFFPADDPGSIVLVAGAAVLDTAANPEQAEQFVDFLLSDCAEQYFAEVTKEYPLIAGVEPADGQPALTEVGGQVADLSVLGSEFSSTVDLIDESGLNS